MFMWIMESKFIVELDPFYIHFVQRHLERVMTFSFGIVANSNKSRLENLAQLEARRQKPKRKREESMRK